MKISTSILSCDDRVKAILELNRTNTSYIHVDVMDGKFVQDKNFDTYEKVHSVSLVSEKKLDIHLMVDNPLEYVEQLSNFNIEYVTFHVEVGKNIDKIIKSIHDMGYKVGLAIKPKTDVKVLKKYLDSIDLILVMCVEPGKGGQKFINSSVEKIKAVKELIGNRDILIEVDGGINDTTIDNVRDVDIAVVGSYIVKSDNYNRVIDSLLNPKSGDLEIEEPKKKNKSFFLKLVSIFVAIIIVLSILYFVYVFVCAIKSMSSGAVDFFGNSTNTYGFDAFIETFFWGIVSYFSLLLYSTFYFFLPSFLMVFIVCCILRFFDRFFDKSDDSNENDNS